MQENDTDDDDNDTIELDSIVFEAYANHRNDLTVESLQNFASKECGARLIGSNPESTNAPNILNSDLDSYALNPCYASTQTDEPDRTRIFFSVQLCEKVSIHRFSLANMEVYSSNPKTIRLLYSSPSSSQENERDWHEIGIFSANNTKDLQTFYLEKPSPYTRVVKIEIIEYFEDDPYCPLTIFHIHGSSFIDKISFTAPSSAKRATNFNAEPPKLNTSETNSNGSSSKIISTSKNIISLLIKYLVHKCKNINFINRTFVAKDLASFSAINNTLPNETFITVKQINFTQNNSFNPNFSLVVTHNICSIREFFHLQSYCSYISTTCINEKLFDENLVKQCSCIDPNFHPFVVLEREQPPMEDVEASSNFSEDEFNVAPEIDPNYCNSLQTMKNKIKELKKNLSLTTTYLEEVSVKFREALDDLRNQTIIRIENLEKNQQTLIESLEQITSLVVEQNNRIYSTLNRMIFFNERFYSAINAAFFFMVTVNFFAAVVYLYRTYYQQFLEVFSRFEGSFWEISPKIKYFLSFFIITSYFFTKKVDDTDYTEEVVKVNYANGFLKDSERECDVQNDSIVKICNTYL